MVENKEKLREIFVFYVIFSVIYSFFTYSSSADK